MIELDENIFKNALFLTNTTSQTIYYLTLTDI